MLENISTMIAGNQVISLLSLLGLLISAAAMPVNRSTPPDIGAIASQPCISPSTPGLQPSAALEAAVADTHSLPSDETSLLLHLTSQLQETREMTIATLNEIGQWVSLVTSQAHYRQLVANVSDHIRVPMVTDAELTTEANSRLHVLLQLSHFVHYLLTQENDPAYLDKTESLKAIRVETQQAACALRSLLSGVGNDVIRHYADEELTNRQISLENESNQSLKRIVTYIALDTMLQVLESIQVSVASKSVTLTSNK